MLLYLVLPRTICLRPISMCAFDSKCVSAANTIRYIPLHNISYARDAVTAVTHIVIGVVAL